MSTKVYDEQKRIAMQFVRECKNSKDLEDLITKAKASLLSTKLGEIRVGTKVKFKPRKTKPEVFGTVKSINAKTCTIVDCSDGGPGWRVSPSLLSVAQNTFIFYTA